MTGATGLAEIRRARRIRCGLARWGALCAAALLGAAQAAPTPLDVLRSGASDSGFERAERVRAFEFPQDHGPHPGFRHEWWYFTGHVQAKDGERFGFEVTFFRVALAPRLGHGTASETGAGATAGTAGTAGAVASRWRTRQIYVAHLAVTDIGRRRFHSTQRFARDALGLSGAQGAPFRVWLGGWSVAGADDWTLRAGDCAYRLDLRLHPLLAPVLNGDRGLSVKSDEPDTASYYYSIPRLEVKGAIVRGGCRAGGAQAHGMARRLPVSGIAWLDREWGSGSLGPRERGWDWFALQLTDGSALMFYQLREEDGGRDPHSAGTWVDAGGSAHALASRDVQIDVLGRWRSPTGARYPARWRVRVAALGLDVTAAPVLADQELETTPRYWEGDVDVAGTRGGRPVSGEGYVELVGYARR
jgi:predicted secreted hydrolase